MPIRLEPHTTLHAHTLTCTCVCVKFRMGVGHKFSMGAKVTECARAARRRGPPLSLSLFLSLSHAHTHTNTGLATRYRLPTRLPRTRKHCCIMIAPQWRRMPNIAPLPRALSTISVFISRPFTNTDISYQYVTSICHIHIDMSHDNVTYICHINLSHRHVTTSPPPFHNHTLLHLNPLGLCTHECALPFTVVCRPS